MRQLNCDFHPTRNFLREGRRGLRGPAFVLSLLLYWATIGNGFSPVLQAAEAGAEVAVVYNTKVPESKEVAEYYAKRREVPSNQLIGLDLPTGEAMTRKEYVQELQEPLLKKLEAGNLFTFSAATNQSADGRLGQERFRVVTHARIRYLLLCYGVPTKILKDTTLTEPSAASMPVEMQRNEGAVDTQLALLPVVEQRLPWAGPLASPFYGATNGLRFQPTNGILMVTRLDGPSPAIARGLVDKAMEAETNGWWGRAFIDARGLGTNDTYRAGDDMMRGVAAVAQRFGLETELDQKPETFPAGHPLVQVAFYAGWYDQAVSGPFTRPTVDFMPGAFAYHLYSFNANTIRAPSSWVGTLLQKGATCTMGAVDEPYLQGTPDISNFLHRFTFLGFTFGEAAYAAQGALSWQTVIIGDPLYRPTRIGLEARHRQLVKDKSPLLEWSHLLVINRNASIGSTPTELIRYIESDPFYRQSAVLTEKLGDLYWAKGSLGDGVDTCETALKRNPSPPHRMRLLLKCAEKRAVYGPDAKAYGHYDTLLKENPGYPEALKIYQTMLPLARRLNNNLEVERCEREIKKLTAAHSTSSGQAPPAGK